MQKIVYNKKNGLEVKLDKSDVCPISGRWLIPSKCTETPPPENEQGFALEFIDGAWRRFEILDENEKEKANSFQKGPSASKPIREEIEELKSKVNVLESEIDFLKSEIKSLVEKER